VYILKCIHLPRRVDMFILIYTPTWACLYVCSHTYTQTWACLNIYSHIYTPTGRVDMYILIHIHPPGRVDNIFSYIHTNVSVFRYIFSYLCVY